MVIRPRFSAWQPRPPSADSQSKNNSLDLTPKCKVYNYPVIQIPGFPGLSGMRMVWVQAGLNKEVSYEGHTVIAGRSVAGGGYWIAGSGQRRSEGSGAFNHQCTEGNDCQVQGTPVQSEGPALQQARVSAWLLPLTGFSGGTASLTSPGNRAGACITTPARFRWV